MRNQGWRWSCSEKKRERERRGGKEGMEKKMKEKKI